MLGVVIAGGRGARLGGSKALAALAGRPLLDWALDALRPVAGQLAVVAKAGTRLPPLPPSVAVWHEPPADHHPRHGLVHALQRAAGASVVVLAVDLPLVTPASLEALVAAAEGRLAAIASARERRQPLCGVYATGALPVLLAAVPDEPLTATVARLAPAVVEVVDPAELTNVNTRDDLARAAALLRRLGGGQRR